MARISTFANEKGGVGKTSLATNAAQASALLGKTTLLIDADSSANATLITSTETARNETKGLAAIIAAESAELGTIVEDCIVQSKWHPNLDLIPASSSLQDSLQQAASKPGAAYRLRRAIASVQNHYDVIIFDTPPSLSIVTEMALIASDTVFVPLEPRYLSTAGLQQIFNRIEEIRDGWEHYSLKIGGILITKFDARMRGHREIVEELQQSQYVGQLLCGIIPVSEAVTYSQNDHQSIFDYDAASPVGDAIRRFVMEVMLAEKEEAHD
jgi:chromosome partitioning protein